MIETQGKNSTYQMIKRGISLCLAVLTVVAMLPFAALGVAAAGSGDFTYAINGDGTATVTGYTGSDTKVVIPEEIDGYKVSAIGGWAFESCTFLTNITIPDSVTSIGSGAFSDCTSLTSITIPKGVISLGYINVFDGCSSLATIYVAPGNTYYSSEDGVLYSFNKTELIRYPEGKIGNEFAIPDSVTSIEEFAFSGCTSIIRVMIPNSVTSIDRSAFFNCTSLTNITIPDSVTWIGNNAFFDTAYYNSSDNWANGVLYIGKHLIKCEESFSGGYAIKEGTKTVAESAFYQCTSLTSVTIPDSVTSIVHSVFENCTALTSVTIPRSVTSIENEAFWNCTSLANITIPNSVTSIGDGAFYGCSSLTSITMPDSATLIGFMAFSDCISLTRVIIPEGITAIKGGVFSGCASLTSIIIPGSVTSIGYSAFDGCSSLEKIYYAGSEEEWNAIEKGINDFSGIEIVFNYKKIELTSAGDIDGDGRVTSRDLLALKKYLQSVLSEDAAFVFGAADVDGDGSVTTKDLLKLKRLLLGGE